MMMTTMPEPRVHQVPPGKEQVDCVALELVGGHEWCVVGRERGQGAGAPVVASNTRARVQFWKKKKERKKERKNEEETEK